MGESPTLMGRFGGRAGAFLGVRARGATVATPQCPAYAPCGSLDLVSGAVLLYSESSEVPRASIHRQHSFSVTTSHIRHKR